jgi:crotonobetaine/carnitine-CoA ligase
VYALEELTLADLLRQKAITHRDEPFLKLRDGCWSFGEVERTAARLARGLADHGVAPGGHVAVMLPNGAELVHVVFALARLGAVAVPINTDSKGELLRHVVSTSDATMWIVDETFVDRVAAVEAELPALRSVAIRSDRAAERSLRTPALALTELLARPGGAPRAPVRFSDLQAIMYTSGTTGPSKGVMVPHALALTCALDSMKYMAFQPGETVYCPLPLYHAAGLWDGMMMALLAGSPIAVVERFSASCFWDDVRSFGASHAMGVFDMIPILLGRPPAADDKDHLLRRFYMGKSALDEPLFERFGVHSVETYTSTEIGIGTASPFGEWRVGSCGRVNRERFELTVVDEQDREVEPGQPGEIVVRPKQPYVITTGYYNCPEVTAEAFRNLWFHTGDRAYRDEDGYFYFVNRIKDSIRRGGQNISAFEVERSINAHQAVLESAAFAVPSELEEEELMVAVVPQPRTDLEPEELAAWCREQLPRFMMPRYFELVGELPRTTTGKIAKHALRAEGDGGITGRTWDAKRRESRSP